MLFTRNNGQISVDIFGGCDRIESSICEIKEIYYEIE